MKEEKVHDITMKIWDLQEKRIMAMSDAEIMADAIREFGSPAKVEAYVERVRKTIANAQWGIRSKRNLKNEGECYGYGSRIS